MSAELNSNTVNNRRLRLGIFGGTFDPIHNAHIRLALAAKDEYNLDRVHILVSGQPPHKLNKEKTADNLRFEMARLACISKNGLIADDYEIRHQGIDYTYLTLQHFNKEYPDADIYFIIGEDSLFDIERWKKPEIILSIAGILVAKRQGGNYSTDILDRIEYLNKKYNAKIDFISSKIDFISSTMIREKLKYGLRCDDFIPKKVMDFINEKGLYKDV